VHVRGKDCLTQTKSSVTMSRTNPDKTSSPWRQRITNHDPQPHPYSPLLKIRLTGNVKVDVPPSRPRTVHACSLSGPREMPEKPIMEQNRRSVNWDPPKSTAWL